MPKTPTKYPLIMITGGKRKGYIIDVIYLDSSKDHWFELTHQELVALKEALIKKLK